MTQATRVLVVDDSALVRQSISNLLRLHPDVTVVGRAADGAEALQKIAELDPDLLTLDVQMPEMDGIAVLREIKKRRWRTKAIMVSSFTSAGAQVTTDALMEGAFDFVLKPSGGTAEANRQELHLALTTRIDAFRESQRSRSADKAVSASAPSVGQVAQASPVATSPCRAVLIGTSTGGPAALKSVLTKLPVSLPVPVLVVQHMPPKYTASLARRLNELSALQVTEAVDGAEAVPGTVLLAPGGKQMMLVAGSSPLRVRLTDDPPELGCRPSINYLFRSATTLKNGHALAVIMTGMGRDGVAGCSALKTSGGYVFAQDEESSVVYGIPKAIVDEQLADRVLPLGKIAPAIMRHVKRSAST